MGEEASGSLDGFDNPLVVGAVTAVGASVVIGLLAFVDSAGAIVEVFCGCDPTVAADRYQRMLVHGLTG